MNELSPTRNLLNNQSILYLIVLRQLVESAEELVQRGDQLRGRQFFGERREVHDVGVQDAVGT